MVLIGRPDAGGVRPVTSDRRVRSPRVQCSEEPNGSIHRGSLFKPHDRLKLTLLAICIDIVSVFRTGGSSTNQ